MGATPTQGIGMRVDDKGQAHAVDIFHDVVAWEDSLTIFRISYRLNQPIASRGAESLDCKPFMSKVRTAVGGLLDVHHG